MPPPSLACVDRTPLAESQRAGCCICRPLPLLMLTAFHPTSVRSMPRPRSRATTRSTCRSKTLSSQTRSRSSHRPTSTATSGVRCCAGGSPSARASAGACAARSPPWPPSCVHCSMARRRARTASCHRPSASGFTSASLPPRRGIASTWAGSRRTVLLAAALASRRSGKAVGRFWARKCRCGPAVVSWRQSTCRGHGHAYACAFEHEKGPSSWLGGCGSHILHFSRESAACS